MLDAYDFKPISIQDVPPLDDRSIYTRKWSVDPGILFLQFFPFYNFP